MVNRRGGDLNDYELDKIKDVIDKDYITKMKYVNNQALSKLEKVQLEHSMVVAKTQDLYKLKK